MLKIIQGTVCLLVLLITQFACSEGEPEKVKSDIEEKEQEKSSFIEIPNWAGSYQDTLPCKDCVGQLTKIDLNSDSTYKKSIVLLGKEPVFDNSFSFSGKLAFNSLDQTFSIGSDSDSLFTRFILEGDSVLKFLDKKGLVEKRQNFWLPKIR